MIEHNSLLRKGYSIGGLLNWKKSYRGMIEESGWGEASLPPGDSRKTKRKCFLTQLWNSLLQDIVLDKQTQRQTDILSQTVEK